MPRVDLVPATAEDFAELGKWSKNTPIAAPVRVLGIAAKIEGRVVGIGGIAFNRRGQKVAFADITDEARKYPIAIHKAGLAAIALAKNHGLKQLVSTGESHEASVRWLLRLGFRPDPTGNGNFVLDL